MQQAHQKFKFIARGKFRRTINPQRKLNRNLNVPRPIAQKLAQEPRLKRISARRVRSESTSRNQFRPNATESRSAILNMRNPPKPPNKPRPSKTYQFTLPRKPRNISARRKPRPDHQIVSFLTQANHLRYLRRIVLKIRVHLQNQIRIECIDRMRNTMFVRRAQSISFSREKMQPGIQSHGRTHIFSTPVRRFIIHNQNVQLVRRYILGLLEYQGNQPGQILNFIKRRKHNAGNSSSAILYHGIARESHLPNARSGHSLRKNASIKYHEQEI